MSWDRWHHDPREGEWPEPMALCDHGVDTNEADCGICRAEEIAGDLCAHGRDRGHDCPDCEQAVTEAMARAMVNAMDRILGGGK